MMLEPQPFSLDARLRRMFAPVTPDEVKAIIRKGMEASGYQVGEITLWLTGSMMSFSPPDKEGWCLALVPYDELGFSREDEG